MQGLSFAGIPEALANLTALETIDFGGDPHGGGKQPLILGGPLPPALSNLPNVTSFGITGAVNGSIPGAYGNWTKLVNFRLAGTALTGTVPPALFRPSLVNFSINGARITDGLDGIFNATALKEVAVEATPVSGAPWFLDARAAALTGIQRLGFGESGETTPGKPSLSASSLPLAAAAARLAAARGHQVILAGSARQTRWCTLPQVAPTGRCPRGPP